MLLLSFFSTHAQLEQYYIPANISAPDEPMVLTTDGDEQEGYVLADQSCAESTAAFDTFCVNTDWDIFCQDRYNRCLYEVDDCGGDWYIPETIGSGAIVFGCEAPEGYLLADQVCAQEVVTNDPFCVNTNWDNLCSRAYNCCLGNNGCNDFTACNYDPTLCEDNSLCLYIDGCTDSFACNFNPDAGCDDGSCTFPGCTDLTACNYEETAGCDDGSCSQPQYYIPCILELGPMVLACERPTDYILANQECAQARVDDDPFCLVTSWDDLCQSAYDCCINEGCSDFTACNYDPSVSFCFNTENCVYGGCTYPDAENYDPSATCDDGSCFYQIASGCIGDLNGDFAVTSGDLSIFLAAFGTTCPIPLAD